MSTTCSSRRCDGPLAAGSENLTTALVLLLCVGGIDEDLREDIRFGWRGPVQDVVARTLHIGLHVHPVFISNGIAWLAGDEKLHGTSEQAYASWAASTAVLMGIRAVVNRPRPEYPIEHWWDSCFPSGHTVTYFSTAAVYAVRYPELRWPLGVVGVLVGLSRIYLGEHYPSDVLAGAALGTGTALLAARFWPEDGVAFLRTDDWELAPTLGRVATDGPGLGLSLRF